MSWLNAVLISLLTGVLGLVCGGLVMLGCVKWYQVSSFEGKAGLAVLNVAILGGLGSIIIAIVVTAGLAASSTQGWLATLPGFARALGLSAGIVLALAGITATVARALADVPPGIDGAELMLEVEIRWPASMKELPSSDGNPRAARFGLASVSGRVQRARVEGEWRLAEARREDGRWIVPGSVGLFTSRGKRMIDFQLPGGEPYGFFVPLPAHPGPAFESWSEWCPRPRAGQPAWPDTSPSFRFRVARIAPPAPRPGPEEEQARIAEEEEEGFQAMPADAPLADWFRYTAYGASDERRAAALERITARPEYVEELAALMLAEDARIAAEALYLVRHLPQPPMELVAPVEAAGRDIARRLEEANSRSLAEDPSRMGAAEVSIRFSAWMEAVRTLREKRDGDFVPELRTILELSRVRDDSYALRLDVRRVASYYLEAWAGVAPLPGDPPPR